MSNELKHLKFFITFAVRFKEAQHQHFFHTYQSLKKKPKKTEGKV